MKAFGEILTELRKSDGLNQGELANKLKLSRSTIAMYERGERTPTKEGMELIADFFNVDMEYLYGRTEIKRSCDLSLMERGYRLDKDAKIHTIAAHRDSNEDWTDDELVKIEEYKNLILAARNASKQ